MGAVSIRVSEPRDATAAGHYGAACGAGEVYRHAAATCERAGVEADEARRVGGYLPETDRAYPADHSRSRHSHQLHRGIPGRNGRGFRRVVRLRESGAV